MLVCRDPASDHALSNAIFGGEHFVATFAGKIVLNHFAFELEVMFPHEYSKVVSNSLGSVHSRGGSVFEEARDIKFLSYFYVELNLESLS